MNEKLITSYEMLEKLKEIIDVPDDIISLKMTLEINSYAILQIDKFLTADEAIARGIPPGTRTVEDKYVCIRPAELDEIIKQRDDALKRIETLSEKIKQFQDHGWDK